MIIERKITRHLTDMLTKFPVLSLTGPRQSGKTTLLKHVFPHYQYFNMERVDHREMVLTDPIGFLKSAGPKIIFDEVQNVPELFSFIQVMSDERNTPGQYILSGSQSFLLNERISQSLAGRVYVSHLFPFDSTELGITRNQNICQIIYNGFYPRLYDHHIAPHDFYPSYLQTYVERDIRTLKAIENLNTFTRFLGMCAGRIGQVLNLTSLANDTGITVNTAKAWLSLLESSFIVFQLQPYYRNFNKRLIKSPKLYFYDTGLACSLLKLTSPEMVSTHYLYGALFENLIISEIIKFQNHSGLRPSVYYWRESNGLEIDCIVEKGNNEVIAIEIKGGLTFNKSYLKNFRIFQNDDMHIQKRVIYVGETSTILSGIRIIGWNDLLSLLNETI
ncbi:MAG: ATP-binding protein [Mangrovibacterium sp.]